MTITDLIPMSSMLIPPLSVIFLAFKIGGQIYPCSNVAVKWIWVTFCPNHVKVIYFEREFSREPLPDDVRKQYLSFIEGMSSFNFHMANHDFRNQLYCPEYFINLTQLRVQDLRTITIHLLLLCVKKVDKDEWSINEGLLRMDIQQVYLSWTLDCYKAYAAMLRNYCCDPKCCDVAVRCAFRILTSLYKEIFDSTETVVNWNVVAVDEFPDTSVNRIGDLLHCKTEEKKVMVREFCGILAGNIIQNASAQNNSTRTFWMDLSGNLVEVTDLHYGKKDV